MNSPEKIRKPTSKMDPEVRNIVKVLLRDIEVRRQMLNKKISLPQLEVPVKIVLK